MDVNVRWGLAAAEDRSVKRAVVEKRLVPYSGRRADRSRTLERLPIEIARVKRLFRNAANNFRLRTEQRFPFWHPPAIRVGMIEFLERNVA